MRWLCLDPGLKRTGVAISSPEGGFALPLLVLEHDANGPAPDVIASLLQEHDAQGLVIGLPLSMDGTASAQTRDAFAFALRMARYLHATVELPPDVVVPEIECEDAAHTPTGTGSAITVALWDERLTSWQAERAASLPDRDRRIRPAKRRNLDAHAAAVILQSFLEARSAGALPDGTDAAGSDIGGEQD